MFQNNYLRRTSTPIARSHNDRMRTAWISRFERQASDGWKLHFVTILFRSNFPPKCSHAGQEQAVYDAYSFFRSQVYRRPNSELMDNAPQLLGFLEDGSLKQEKVGIPNGCHFHGLLAIPPTIGTSRQQRALERMTRLLPNRHPHIARVHTEPVKSVEKAIRYASKQIRSRGDREWDPIIAPLRAEERLEKPANVRRHETPETTLIKSEASNASTQNPLVGDENMKKINRSLTRGDIAKKLNISLACFDGMRKRAEGPAEFVIGRSVRFDPSDVKAWMAERTASAKKGAPGSGNPRGASAVRDPEEGKRNRLKKRKPTRVKPGERVRTKKRPIAEAPSRRKASGLKINRKLKRRLP